MIKYFKSLYWCWSLAIAFSLDFNPNVSVFPDNQNHEYPDIEVSEDGTIHITWVRLTGGSKNLYYAKSEDSGLSFSEPQMINTDTNMVVAFAGAGPRIESRFNDIFIVWADQRNGYYQTGIYMAHSTNNGDTWSEIGEVSDTPHFKLYADIEIDLFGRLHLVYYNFNSNLMFEDVRYAVTNGWEQNFSSSINTNVNNGIGEPCDCCAPDMAINENGDVYIAFRHNISNIRDHYVSRKPAGTDSFLDAVPISNTGFYLSYCPSSGPSIDVNNNLFASGHMLMNTTNTYLAVSDADLSNFSEGVNVNETFTSAMQNHPSIALIDDVVHVVWMDLSSGSGDIKYGILESDYNQLTDNIQTVNDDDGNHLQSHPRMTKYNENLYCVWVDGRGSANEVYFSSTIGYNITPGDATQDGMVDVLDIVTMVTFIMAQETPDMLQLMAADMDSNGLINILDIIQVINIILG